MWWGKRRKNQAELVDYYSILGVSQGASQVAISRAFRKLAQSCHPDRNNSEEAKEKFQELVEAYQVLKSLEKRKAYDARIISEFCKSFVISLGSESVEPKKKLKSEFQRILKK